MQPLIVANYKWDYVRNLLTSGLISIGYSVVSRAGILATNLIAVRLLSSHEYGVLSIYLTIVTSIATISTFGLGVTCNQIASSKRETNPDLVKAVIAVSMLIATVLSAIISLFYILVLQEEVRTELGLAVAVTSIISISWIISITGVLEGGLYGTRNYNALLRNALISTSITVPLIALSTTLFALIGTVSAVVISKALMLVLHLRSLKCGDWIVISMDIIKKQKTVISQAFFHTSLPVALSGLLAGPTIALAITLLANNHGAASAGYVAWPYQIYLIATFIPGALGHFLTSRFSGDQHRNRNPLAKTIAFGVALGIVTFAVMLFFKNRLLNIAGQDFLENASEVFKYFAYCTVISGLNVAFFSYWTSTQQAWTHLGAQAIWSLTLIITITIQLSSHGPAAISMGFFYGLIAQAMFNFSALIIKNYLAKRIQ